MPRVPARAKALREGDRVSVAVRHFGKEYAVSRGGRHWASDKVRDAGFVVEKQDNQFLVDFSDGEEKRWWARKLLVFEGRDSEPEREVRQETGDSSAEDGDGLESCASGRTSVDSSDAESCVDGGESGAAASYVAGNNKKLPLLLIASALSMVDGEEHVKRWTTRDADGETTLHELRTAQPEMHQIYREYMNLIDLHNKLREGETVSYTHLTLPTKRIV